MLNILSPIRAAAIVAASVCLILSAVFTVADDDCPHIKPKIIACPGHTPTNCGNIQIVMILGIPTPMCVPATYVDVSNEPLSNQSNGEEETNTQVDTGEDNEVICWTTSLCIINPLVPTTCKKSALSVNHKVSPLIQIDC